jgi:hypothetical protein
MAYKDSETDHGADLYPSPFLPRHTPSGSNPSIPSLMATALSFSSSELLALCFESVLYGVYLVLLTDCIKVLINKRRRRAGGNVRLIVISASLFLLITWHEAIDALRLYMAYKDSETDHGADLYYFNVTSMLSVMKTSVYLVETLASDLFILYRCYVVWNSNLLVIVLPVLLYIADAGMFHELLALVLAQP